MRGYRTAAVARNELALLAADPGAVIVVIGAPLVLLPFVEPLMGRVLQAQGLRATAGAAQAVAGLSTMFGLFLLYFVALTLFREHGWNTWSRMRMGPATPFELIVGKAVPLGVLLFVQQIVLFVVGRFAYGTTINGSVSGVVLVAAAMNACVLALGFALAGVCRSLSQVEAVSTLVALALSSLGGALTPASILPRGLAAIAPYTPGFWAIEGMKQAILGPRVGRSPVLAAAVLLVFAVFFVSIAVWRLRFDDDKGGQPE